MTVKSRRFLFLAATLVALNAFFWLAGGGLALPKSIVNQFFGNRMVRAEVILQSPGGTQDWRIDRGVVASVSGGNVTLMEADGTSVTVALDPAARIQGARKVRARMRVVLYHLASQPAQLVQVEGAGS
jgi:hypothetical protein